MGELRNTWILTDHFQILEHRPLPGRLLPGFSILLNQLFKIARHALNSPGSNPPTTLLFRLR